MPALWDSPASRAAVAALRPPAQPPRCGVCDASAVVGLLCAACLALPREDAAERIHQRMQRVLRRTPPEAR